MKYSKRVKILKIFVDSFNTDEVLNRVKCYIDTKEPHFVITANSLMVNQVTSDPELEKAFHSAAVVVPDSAGIVWAARFLEGVRLQRIPGIDLMMQICRMAVSGGYSVYLLGSEESVNHGAVRNLLHRFPGLRMSGRKHGYFSDEEEVIKDIRSCRPDILFVGLDVPRQEKWIMRNFKTLDVPLVMGIGGSFDILSGRLRRAPIWMRLAGFEWFYRFLQQPWRIGRIIYLPIFMIKVIAQRYALRYNS